MWYTISVTEAIPPIPLTPPITSFTDQYRFLSNFWPSPILYDSILFPTIEHFYQAMKVTDRYKRVEISQIPTPAQANLWGRELGRRPDWNAIRLPIMKFAIEQKFQPQSPLSTQLLATGDAELINGFWRGSTYWGVERRGGVWVGKNNLGKILMERRSQLRIVL